MKPKELYDVWEDDPDAKIVFNIIELQEEKNNHFIVIEDIKKLTIQDNSDTARIKFEKEVKIDEKKEKHTFILECQQITEKTSSSKSNKEIPNKTFNIYLREKKEVPFIQVCSRTQDISIVCFHGSLQTADGVCKKPF